MHPSHPKVSSEAEAEAARRILKNITKQLRRERARGRAGHWTYDLARHQALIAEHCRYSNAILVWEMARKEAA